MTLKELAQPLIDGFTELGIIPEIYAESVESRLVSSSLTLSFNINDAEWYWSILHGQCYIWPPEPPDGDGTLAGPTLEDPEFFEKTLKIMGYTPALTLKNLPQ